MAACLALALSLVATARSFVLPARGMSQAQTCLMSSSSSSSSSSPAAAAFPLRSLSHRGGRGGVREIVGGIRGGKSEPAGALSASSVDAVGGEVLDVLGGNEGVLNEEQRAMAATLVQLGQVGGVCAVDGACVYADHLTYGFAVLVSGWIGADRLEHALDAVSSVSSMNRMHRSSPSSIAGAKKRKHRLMFVKGSGLKG